jgi:chemotaxis protein methyltransferase CheR
MLHEVVSVEVVRHFCHIATRRLGVGMDPKVEALVAGRVAKRLKVLQVPLDEYLSRLEGDQNCDEVVGFLEVMRPKPASFFFRSADHARLHAQLRRWLLAGRRRFRLWSAGCGSGEEPYAMALTALHAIEDAQVPSEDVDWKILASDVSLRILERGKKGVFDEAQVSDVPEAVAERFFVVTSEGARIRSDVKAHVIFRRLNIAQPPFPMTGPLDAVFCHEGLLPLLPKVRRRVIDAASALLGEDGIFCTGFDEGSLGATDDAELEDWQELAHDSTHRQGNC